ncbi:MAG: Gfo/Idh/MocA family oxidoreductase [Spirochaetia bacterium]|nr:Gfo/Idh/MocA family oxidoreductase [Spirochaetia bacterium]
MKPIRTALIGLGRIAWMLEQDTLRYHPCTHAGTLRKLKKQYDLVGAADRNPERIRAFEKWWKAPLIHSKDSKHMLDACKPELIIIAASVSSHMDLFRQAIAAKPAGIVLEKPPTEDYESTRSMLRLARNIPVWVNYERRYHPNYKHVKELIASGSLGEIRSIRGQVLVGHSPGAGEAGPLLHDASHWVDLLLWFVGPPKSVSARLLAEKGRPEHTAFVQFHYPAFGASLESGGRRKYFEFEMQIDFSEGRVLCGNKGLQVFQSTPSRKYQGFLELIEKRLKLSWSNPWIGLYHDVYDVMRNSHKSPAASLGSAAEGMKWIDRIWKASKRSDRVRRIQRP